MSNREALVVRRCRLWEVSATGNDVVYVIAPNAVRAAELVERDRGVGSVTAVFGRDACSVIVDGPMASEGGWEPQDLPSHPNEVGK
jgi:hypothetical protein